MLYHSNNISLSDQGKFRIYFHLPGFSIPGHTDHGYGPLATVAESFMDPDTWVKLHQHKNEEIISWVPEGVMRHNDKTVGELITDKDHLMIMNAGSGFWHEERTLATDPPLRMLQIFVRPYALDLSPGIQHKPLAPGRNNEWRNIFGPVGSDFYVRNDIQMHDIRLDKGTTTQFPAKPGYDTFFLVYTGAIKVKDQLFRMRGNGLIVDETGVLLEAVEDTLLVAFSINPKAVITKEGTIGR
ncbi:pirin family protein [Chitinophaga sp. 30R24]|uniref:pirin family protein n=1 Tax=Chitinophaga sp. 30R24 TaxID=3248838 RepID=UPI003B90BD62